MRKLVYDCYVKNVKVATVGTYKEAQAWLNQDRHNRRIKDSVIELSTKEAKKDKEERLARIEKRNKARANRLKDAAVG